MKRSLDVFPGKNQHPGKFKKMNKLWWAAAAGCCFSLFSAARLGVFGYTIVDPYHGIQKIDFKKSNVSFEDYGLFSRLKIRTTYVYSYRIEKNVAHDSMSMEPIEKDVDREIFSVRPFEIRRDHYRQRFGPFQDTAIKKHL